MRLLPPPARCPPPLARHPTLRPFLLLPVKQDRSSPHTTCKPHRDTPGAPAGTRAAGTPTAARAPRRPAAGNRDGTRPPPPPRARAPGGAVDSGEGGAAVGRRAGGRAGEWAGARAVAVTAAAGGRGVAEAGVVTGHDRRDAGCVWQAAQARGPTKTKKKTAKSKHRERAHRGAVTPITPREKPQRSGATTRRAHPASLPPSG